MRFLDKILISFVRQYRIERCHVEWLTGWCAVGHCHTFETNTRTNENEHACSQNSPDVLRCRPPSRGSIGACAHVALCARERVLEWMATWIMRFRLCRCQLPSARYSRADSVLSVGNVLMWSTSRCAHARVSFQSAHRWKGLNANKYWICSDGSWGLCQSPCYLTHGSVSA